MQSHIQLCMRPRLFWPPCSRPCCSASPACCVHESSGTLQTMSAWLAEGEAEGQTTFLRQLLLTLPRLPFSAHMLAGAPLVGAVQRLTRHRQAPVFVVCDWHHLSGVYV